MTLVQAMQSYYDVDGSPVAVKGIQEKIQRLQLFLNYLRTNISIWWASSWNSREDFENLSAKNLMDKNLKIYGKTISMLSLINEGNLD